MIDDLDFKLIEDVSLYLAQTPAFNSKINKAIASKPSLDFITDLITNYLDFIKHGFTTIPNKLTAAGARKNFDTELTKCTLKKYWPISSKYLNLDSEIVPPTPKDPKEKVIAQKLILDSGFMSAFNRLLTAKSATYALQEQVRNHNSTISWASTSSMAVIIWMNHLLGKDGKNEKWIYLQFPPFPSQESTSQEKENEIMATKFFELKPFVNGKELSKDLGGVFQEISAQECHIKHLETISNKPQILIDEIVNAKAEIAALVTYLDSIQPSHPVPATA